MSDSDESWGRLQHYRRLYGAWSVVLALSLIASIVLMDIRTAFIAAVCLTGVAVGGILWSYLRLGSTACPHCKYRLRSIDALFWKHCRHCKSALIQESTA
jgi:hypothetical protein